MKKKRSKKITRLRQDKRAALAGTTGSVTLPYIENRPDEQIVSMVQHAGTVFIATRYRIYRLDDNKEWQPIPFVNSPNT